MPFMSAKEFNDYDGDHAREQRQELLDRPSWWCGPIREAGAFTLREVLSAMALWLSLAGFAAGYYWGAINQWWEMLP
jgi:hypothetical protein